MRRIVALLVAALVLLPVAGHADPGATSRHSAWAMFEGKPRRGMVPNVGVYIDETRSAAGTEATFMIMKGFCPQGSTGMEECAVTSSGFVSGVLEPDQYEIDPLLRTATVDLVAKGRRYLLTWSAGDPIQPDAFETYCESGDPSFATRAGFSADTSGTIAGKNVTTSRSGLENVTFLSTCSD